MKELDLLVENYFTPALDATDILRLVEQVMNEPSEDIFKQIGRTLSSRKDEFGISSVVRTGKNDVYVRFATKKDRSMGVSGVKGLLSKNGLIVNDRKLSSHSIPVSYVSKVDDNSSRIVKIVYKYDIQTRTGLAFEHILAYVITNRITEKLKKSIDLPKDATDDEVKATLNSDKWREYTNTRAPAAYDSIKREFGEVEDAIVAGGTGSKADLVLTVNDGKKVGISLKLAIASTNIYIYNKDIGDGTESKSLIPSPTGEPWWMVGRKRFFNELRKKKDFPDNISYNPSSSDYNPPDWMLLAKKQYSQTYDEVVMNLFTEIRNKLFDSLGNMTLESLADIVEEAHLGKASPNEERMPLYKLASSRSGISLKEVPQTTPNMVEIELNKLTPIDMVRFKQSIPSKAKPESRNLSTIIIDIPGMHKVYINSIKFRSNLLATNKGNLKIKTR